MLNEQSIHLIGLKTLQVLLKYVPTGLFGEDKDGHPVYYQCLGNFDMKGLAFDYCSNSLVCESHNLFFSCIGVFKSCKEDDLLKLMVMQAEQCLARLKEFSAKVHVKLIIF